jgi:hypothetical protein
VNPTAAVLAEINQCREVLARLEQRLANLEHPEPLPLALAGHAIAQLNLRLITLFKKAYWGSTKTPAAPTKE